MRRCRSYSIVDHQFLHRGYFSSLSYQSLSLYLFFVVAGNRDGLSYYSEISIAEKLHMAPSEFLEALDELLKTKLIRYERPHFHVTEFEYKDPLKLRDSQKTIIRKQIVPSPRPASNKTIGDCFKEIFGDLK